MVAVSTRRCRRSGLGSTTLATWTVAKIAPETVTGRNVDADAETVWNREELERGLVTGAYSTNLTDFEMTSVYEVGPRGDDR